MINQCLTGKDNQTHDVVRWLTVLAVLTGIGLQIHHSVQTGEFDLQQYGAGIGILLAASGVTLKLKESTEPEPKS